MATMDLPTSAKVVLPGLVAAWLLKNYVTAQKHLPFPPGPKCYPLLGNILDMPTEYEWVGAYEMKKKYGDLVFLQVPGKRILFVNSYKMASDLLEKRSSIYSSRPSSVMMNDLLEWDWFTSNMPYGERWKKHRQQLHPFLEPSSVKKYVDRQTRDAHMLLRSLLDSPEDFLAHIRKHIGATIMMIAYGHEVESQDDPYIKLIEEGIEYVAHAARPGAFMVEIFPWLKYVPEWVPGADFQRFAREGREMSINMKLKPFNAVKEKVLQGTARSCIASDLIEEGRKENNIIEDEDVIANVAGILYAGGADTSVSTLQTFFLGMVLNPEAKHRAYEELDRVVGNSRLPTLDDKPNLPYINAICLESLRYYPVTPLGGPRELSEDDEYEGYLIPKGTMIVPNVWGIFHDPGEYLDPFAFKPERFLPNEGEKMPLDPIKAAFGFGRRMCPGRYMALNTIFLNIASILSTFDISPAIGEDGKPSIPSGEYVSNVITYPKPFKCSLTPRSQRSVEIINQLCEDI